MAIGGAFGSVLRYKIGALAAPLGFKLPLGTLFVNLVGCFLIGLIDGLAQKRGIIAPETRLLLVTGFLGGFTTFSAFGLETVALLRANKLPLALFYLGFSVAGGLLMVWLGLKLAGALPSKP